MADLGGLHLDPDPAGTWQLRPVTAADQQFLGAAQRGTADLRRSQDAAATSPQGQGRGAARRGLPSSITDLLRGLAPAPDLPPALFDRSQRTRASASAAHPNPVES